MRLIITIALLVIGCIPALSYPRHHSKADTLLGVLTLGPNYSIDDTIKIYNDDGSLWHWVAFKDEIKKIRHPDFDPLGFHPDYFMLDLIVASQKENHFEVIVNDETGLRKTVIEARPGQLRLKTFHEFLKDEAIEFDFETNPIRESIDGKPILNKSSNNFEVKTIGVKNDWLKIKYWDYKAKKETIGWIRWREGDKMLIRLLVG